MDKVKSLAPIIYDVLVNKGTEPPFSGEYDDKDEAGSYLCRRCGQALFRSKTKFHSGCGWPSFDQEISGAVACLPDADGRRTEILCSQCKGHLGHVFTGERHTVLNVRHCVNSLSLDFVPDMQVTQTGEAIFAGGCFWGVEYFFAQEPGVLKTEVGYTGGAAAYPTYEQVCSHNTGHIEAIRIVYDLEKTSYLNLLRTFFEIHDPTQTNGQGPDIGEQYLSAVFYFDENQRAAAQTIIDELSDRGYSVATRLLPVKPFYRAEEKHQRYYQKTGGAPYCHRLVKRFD